VSSTLKFSPAAMARVKRENPLSWPVGRKRTKPQDRKRSQFASTRYRGLQDIAAELIRLGVSDARITLDLPLRGRDDLPLDNAREPEDPGVAVYYTRQRKDHVLACDQFRVVHENLAAIIKTIEAQRGITRWGCQSIDEAIAGSRLALSGEASDSRPWREVLEVQGAWTDHAPPAVLLTFARAQYKAKIAIAHPDKGGDATEATVLNGAMDDAERELAETGSGG
jgi:hypothetical protein